MRVINWKTGVTVWEFRDELWSRCRLISQSHAVVVIFDSLRVYPIDRHRTSPAAPATSDTALCILQLPAWSGVTSSRFLQVKSYIQFPPPLRRDDLSLYRQDPALTPLTFEVHYVADTLSTDWTSSSKQCSSPSPPSSPPSRPQPAPPRLGRRFPGGTRIVPLQSERPWRFSPLGCSCAVTQWKGPREPSSGTMTLTAFVFVVHPWAPHAAAGAGEGRRFAYLTEEDTWAGPAFTEAMQTTFPFDVTLREIVCRGDDRAPKVVLVEDGLVVVTSP